MTQKRREFLYSTDAGSRKTILTIAGGLFLSALFLLWNGAHWSFLEGPGGFASNAQNLSFNLILAFVLATSGFLYLFSLWRKTPDQPFRVILSPTSITAPRQGVLAREVEILFADVVRLQKLSVDGIWEFNIFSDDKHIRIPKAALSERDDFEILVARVEELTPQIALEIVSRIDPPDMHS